MRTISGASSSSQRRRTSIAPRTAPTWPCCARSVDDLVELHARHESDRKGRRPRASGGSSVAVVHEAGLEPPHLAVPEPKSGWRVSKRCETERKPGFRGAARYRSRRFGTAGDDSETIAFRRGVHVASGIRELKPTRVTEIGATADRQRLQGQGRAPSVVPFAARGLFRSMATHGSQGDVQGARRRRRRARRRARQRP